ncbi:Putative Rhizopuspepsin-2 [Rhizopus microsporus]|nr:Putative Rhizopuspepsin-2 [Rhizopus microsporus]
MKFTLISSCVAIATMALAVEAAPNGKKLSIPLAKNNDFKPNAKRSFLKALAKYNKTPKGDEISPQSTGSVPVVDVGSDLEYYGVVTVGTPGVQLKLDFDTGSSDLWFASTLCSTCSNSHTKYNPNKSSTYKADGRPWSISYGDGSSASGILAKDTVNLGGLAIKDQTIGLAKRESSAFAEDVIDGLLGLAFNSITTVRGVKTPMDNLISQGLISRPIFGVYLGKASNGGGGEYIFGGYDSTKFKGSLTTVPIDNSEGFWGVTVKGTKIGSKSIGGSFSAILDTGTTLLLLPDSVAASVARTYGASDNGDGTYTITCDSSKLQPLVFTLGSSTFQVPADSLIYEKSGSKCIAGFAAGGDLAILGDVFLKNNYVVFNQQVPEVQIAPIAQ